MKGMRYFPGDDVLYIKVKNGKYSESNPISENLILDIDKDGNTLGIEILHASKELAKAKLPVKTAAKKKGFGMFPDVPKFTHDPDMF
ncbi:MAG: DUF2283 domain-containing protein [Candidatus Micrarchaeota archaeon]